MTRHQITGYTAADRDAVAGLQELLWHAGSPRNAAYLDWKYGQNPYLSSRYVVLAWTRGELVGFVGAFGACWESSGGARAMLPCLSDTVVAPEVRGGSLFTRLLDELIDRLRADGIPLLLDFGDQPAGPAMLMRGWKAIGPWALASATRGELSPPGDWWAERNAPSVLGKRSGLSVRAAPIGPGSVDAMARLVAGLPAQDRIRHVRDVDYLSWRYRNPLARYFHLAAGPRELEGYLVAHRSVVDPNAKGRSTPTTILECEAVDDGLWLDLLEVAIARLPGSPILMWARDISDERVSALRSVGFDLNEPTGRVTRDRHLPNLVVCSTGAATQPPFDRLDAPSAWDLRGLCGRSWR